MFHQCAQAESQVVSLQFYMPSSLRRLLACFCFYCEGLFSFPTMYKNRNSEKMTILCLVRISKTAKRLFDNYQKTKDCNENYVKTVKTKPLLAQ